MTEAKFYDQPYYIIRQVHSNRNKEIKLMTAGGLAVTKVIRLIARG